MNIQARPKSSYIRVYQEINYESHKWWQFVARKYINMPYDTKINYTFELLKKLPIYIM